MKQAFMLLVTLAILLAGCAHPIVLVRLEVLFPNADSQTLPTLPTGTLAPTDFQPQTNTSTPEPQPGPVDSAVARTLAALPSGTQAPTVAQPRTKTSTPIPTPQGGGTGEIAFASNRSGTTQIWIANMDGTNLRQITDTMEGACQPAWSPDGQRLVFISPCESNHESYPGAGLFVINVDGSESDPVPLTNTLGGDYDPTWSPDGTHIAFTSLRNGGRASIYIYSLQDGIVERLSDEYSRDMQPAWSPDGSKIVFTTTRNGPYQIWLMDANGQNQTLFSHNEDWINTYPAWSPDGQLILFTQKTKPAEFPRLVVAPLDEEGMREFIINQNPIPMREAQFSPDGFWMAAESWPGGRNHGIYVMTANGAGRYALDHDPANDFDPAWRPKP